MTLAAEYRRKPFDPGRARDRFTIQRRAERADGGEEWRTVARPWGELAGLSASESWRAREVQSEARFRATIRREWAFDSSQRVTLGERVFSFDGLPIDDGGATGWVVAYLIEQSTPFSGGKRPALLLDPASDFLESGGVAFWSDRCAARGLVSEAGGPVPTRRIDQRRGALVVDFPAGAVVRETQANLLRGSAGGSLALMAAIGRPAAPEVSLFFLSRALDAAARRLDLSVTNAGAVRLRIHPSDNDPAALDLASPSGLVGSWGWVVILARWGNGKTAELYLNGALVASAAPATLTLADAPAALVRIGSTPSTTDPAALVALGGAALWNARLTDDEVATFGARWKELWQ